MKTLTPIIKKSKKDGLYYASLQSRNGKQIFNSGDGYKRKADAVKAVDLLRKCKIGMIVFK